MEENMVDTIIEKKLKQDIYKKNLIRSEIERHLGSVSRWKDKIINLKSFRGQRKYTDTIKRCISQIENLRASLNKMNEDVDKQIREVGKFSDSEVKEFSSQLEQKISDIGAGSESEGKGASKNKDIEEIRNARAKLAEMKGKGNVQEKIEKASGKKSEDIEEIERVTGKIVRLNKHLENVGGGTESGSGDQDELFYTQELKRIVREKAIYG
jgi:valyl-tRNA synthetase